jgi:hypothetical protein
MSIGISEKVKTLSFVGWVADFCPVCRTLQPFLIRESHLVESELHLIVGLVPVAHDKDLGSLGHDRVCDACSFCTPASLHPYPAMLKERPADLDSLLRLTHPQAPQLYKERLRIEAEVLEGRVLPETKRALLAETLRSLEPHLRKGLPAPLRTVHWLLPLALVLGGFGMAMVLGERRGVRHLSTLAGLAALVGLVGLLVAGIRAWLRPAFVRRTLVLEAYPLLVRAWTPLRPSGREIEDVLADLRASGSTLAMSLSVERLLRELPAGSAA